jgi:hypothetical protein
MYPIPVREGCGEGARLHVTRELKSGEMQLVSKSNKRIDSRSATLNG